MKKAKSTQKPAHHAHMRHAARTVEAPRRAPLFEVRRSDIHGRGVYAARRIRKGTRVVEYLGDRISHEQADARYEAKGQDDGHTFLFVVNDKVVIDAGVGGNDARFINHSCDPNCETVIEGARVFIEAIRTIRPGEELGYEYGLTWESTDDPDELANYTCRCGAEQCRGTMLDREPLDRKRARTAARKRKAAARKRKNARR
jgi:SET domain-containing protein